MISNLYILMTLVNICIPHFLERLVQNSELVFYEVLKEKKWFMS